MTNFARPWAYAGKEDEMDARNDVYCQAYETITLAGKQWQRISDDHTAWWATPESYRRACELFGDSLADYDDFIDAMECPDKETEAKLDEKLEQYLQGGQLD